MVEDTGMNRILKCQKETTNNLYQIKMQFELKMNESNLHTLNRTTDVTIFNRTKKWLCKRKGRQKGRLSM